MTFPQNRLSSLMSSLRSPLFWMQAVLLFLWAVAGCGYRVGAPYQAHIQSVHVPIFSSKTFRRGIEFELTEAVHKEIQNRTHFRLTKGPYADSRLTAEIVHLDKRALGESAFDDPRELQLSLAVQVTWEDLRTGEILDQQNIPLEPEMVHLISTGDFAPEVGQSLATAKHQAIQKLARQIVQMMEAPW